MDAIEFQYKRIRQKYPDAPELEIWHGVAMDFYLRTGDIPSDVLIRSAFARAETYGVKYRPDQLRVPAGNPDGGQWTDEGGGGGANLRDRVARNRTPADGKPSSSTPSAETSPADAANTPQTYRDDFVPGDQPPIDGAEILPAAGEGGNYGVNLLAHEGINEGHPVSLHVNKSDDFLVNAVRVKQALGRAEYQDNRRLPTDGVRHGTFVSLDAANKLVNATLAANTAKVDQFVRSGERYITISAYFDAPTGREAYAPGWWGDIQIRQTNGVKVVLHRDPSFPGPFRIHTAFPIR